MIELPINRLCSTIKKIKSCTAINKFAVLLKNKRGTVINGKNY